MDVKKKAFLKAYEETFGNVSKSCKAIQISRTAYYKWLEKDNEFKSELESIEPDEDFVEFAQDKLVQRIKDGDTTAIIFALKTKGKKKGFVERQEIQHEGNSEAPVIFKLDERFTTKRD